jgi:hypothetical protein
MILRRWRELARERAPAHRRRVAEAVAMTESNASASTWCSPRLKDAANAADELCKSPPGGAGVPKVGFAAND